MNNNGTSSAIMKAEAAETSPDVMVKRIEGKEMYPEIDAGDLVQVNPCDEVRGGGGLYLVEVDGSLMLQKVQRLPGRRLRLFSANSDFEDAIIRRTEEGWVTDPQGLEVDFSVVGQYVQVARPRRG